MLVFLTAFSHGAIHGVISCCSSNLRNYLNAGYTVGRTLYIVCRCTVCVKRCFESIPYGLCWGFCLWETMWVHMQNFTQVMLCTIDIWIFSKYFQDVIRNNFASCNVHLLFSSYFSVKVAEENFESRFKKTHVIK